MKVLITLMNVDLTIKSGRTYLPLYPISLLVLNNFLSLDNSKEYCNDGDDQKNVYEATRIKANISNGPKYK
jgi:hypothetical protein